MKRVETSSRRVPTTHHPSKAAPEEATATRSSAAPINLVRSRRSIGNNFPCPRACFSCSPSSRGKETVCGSQEIRRRGIYLNTIVLFLFCPCAERISRGAATLPSARADADDILTPFYASHRLNYAESGAKYRAGISSHRGRSDAGEEDETRRMTKRSQFRRTAEASKCCPTYAPRYHS